MSTTKRTDIHVCVKILHEIARDELLEKFEIHNPTDERKRELKIAMDRTFFALIDILSRELGAGEAEMPEITVAEKKKHLRLVSDE